MKLTVVSVVAMLVAVTGISRAQSDRRDSSFVDLRRDGNGFAQLSTRLAFAIERQTADVALRSVAATARLNLTFDPGLAGLSTLVTVPLRTRTVAATLIEIADAANLRMRVGNAAQLIVVRIPPRVTATATAPSRSGDSVVSLPKVVTEAQSMERTQFVTPGKIGALSITGEALGKMPIFVEPDVLRAVQMLPGVEARSDYTAGFNVRGGENDQNLVLIDGFPIYNPYHLGGVFSTFIDPTVGRVDLLRGSLPSQYGGRLSSVLDVRSAEPVREDVHGTAELSLVSAIASAGSSFGDDGSWMIAGRRTYADAVIGALSRYEFPYHFQDFQAHVARGIGGGVRLSTTIYHGLDHLGNSSDEDGVADWGNSVVGVALTKRFDATRFGRMSFDSVTAEQRFSVTRFASNADVLDDLLHASDQVTDNRVAGTIGFHRPRLSQTFGYEVAWQRLAYEAVYDNPSFVDFLPPDSIEQRSNALGLFADQVWHPSSKLIAQIGVRFDNVSQARWSGLSPRVAFKYFVDSNTAINLGGGTYAQWMHSLGREEEPIEPIQFWIASDTLLPVSRSRDVVAGVEHWLSSRRFVHLEAFHKRYRDILRPNAFNDPGKHGDEFEPVSGSSYGFDLLARQVSGKFTGWLAYTYAHSTRTSADGAEFYPPQDRRHNLNLVGSWRLGSNVIGAHVAVASALPTTPIVGEYARYHYSPFDQRWTGSGTGTVRGPFDSARLPWYRRVDVSATHSFTVHGKPLDAYLSVLNLFNFRNPAAYVYDFRGSVVERSSFPNLPFAPTFGVKLAY